MLPFCALMVFTSLYLCHRSLSSRGGPGDCQTSTADGAGEGGGESEADQGCLSNKSLPRVNFLSCEELIVDQKFAK